SIIGVLGIVNQGQRNPSRARGLAMSLVVDVRIRLNDLRSEGWDPLFEEVKAFCVEVGIDIPDMDGPIPRFGQSRRGGRNNITQDHFYRDFSFDDRNEELMNSKLQKQWLKLAGILCATKW
ncbi:hypothetical protein ACJX0J_031158, partial [Zea mays]